MTVKKTGKQVTYCVCNHCDHDCGKIKFDKLDKILEMGHIKKLDPNISRHCFLGQDNDAVRDVVLGTNGRTREVFIRHYEKNSVDDTLLFVANFVIYNSLISKLTGRPNKDFPMIRRVMRRSLSEESTIVDGVEILEVFDWLEKAEELVA